MPSRSRPPKPWWGSGLAPHLEWPNVTIEIPAVVEADESPLGSPDGRYYFDREAADAAVDFFPTFLAASHRPSRGPAVRAPAVSDQAAHAAALRLEAERRRPAALSPGHVVQRRRGPARAPWGIGHRRCICCSSIREPSAEMLRARQPTASKGASCIPTRKS